MKRILLIVTFFMGLYGASVAQFRNSLRGGQSQENSGQGEKLEAVKIGYITQKLNLTPEEAQRFFPVYNQYVAEIKDVNRDQKQNKLSELEREDKILSIRKKYDGEFKKVISAEKVNTFFSLEKDFRQMVQKELQERRMMRQKLRGN